jgi:hypothetical protein
MLSDMFHNNREAVLDTGLGYGPAEFGGTLKYCL